MNTLHHAVSLDDLLRPGIGRLLADLNIPNADGSSGQCRIETAAAAPAVQPADSQSHPRFSRCGPLPKRDNAGTLALVNATLIDGTGAAPLADAVVVIRNGRIYGIGARAAVQIPEGAQIIDVKAHDPARLSTRTFIGAIASRICRPGRRLA
jgi:hypothetical protein